MPLRICFVTAEMAPLAKTGGLADVSGALRKYLHAAGHDVRLFMPAYASIDRERFELYPVEGLQNQRLRLGKQRYLYSVSSLRLPQLQSVYLIDCPALYGRAGIYTGDADEHLRFLLLTHAAFLCCQRLRFAPQILHFNDWHTAMGPLYRRTIYSQDSLFAAARTALTVHNIGYQGIVSATALPELLPAGDAKWLDQAELAAGYINFLRTGIAYADLVITVSPTYAREIQSAEYGMGLEGLLRTRSADVVGILNGVDYDDWDPRHDHYLPQHFDAGSLAVKASLKARLLQRLGLEDAAGTPLIGIVSRLATQKGFDLLFEALPQLLQSRAFELVVLGTGETRYEELFTGLQLRYPGRVHFHRGYSDELAHWIEAASDMFLMPSRYEPCGLNQMYSLRYGTVPIVRRTGGLADSVQQFDAASGQGTGVVFNDYDAGAVMWAVGTGLDLYARPALWQRLVHNAMAADFSWQRSVELYIAAYERLLGK
ncbi:MAG: glycogen synthase [Steroidobacteraceae bacterium]|jgi:starch synthase